MTLMLQQVAYVSGRLISIVCSRVCPVTQKTAIKQLLDHFTAR